MQHDRLTDISKNEAERELIDAVAAYADVNDDDLRTANFLNKIAHTLYTGRYVTVEPKPAKRTRSLLDTIMRPLLPTAADFSSALGVDYAGLRLQGAIEQQRISALEQLDTANRNVERIRASTLEDTFAVNRSERIESYQKAARLAFGPTL